MESREAVCSNCYQQYDTSQTQRCPSCGHPAPEDRESPSASSEARNVAVSPSASAGRWKREVLNPSTLPAYATEAANRLSRAGEILFILGAIGGGLLVLLGFLIPQCSGGGFECSSSSRAVFADPVLGAVGIVGILFWYWVYALSHAISARLLLAVDKASE